MNYFKSYISDLRERELYRSLRPAAGAAGPCVTYRGRNILMLSSNNYLGLANHPQLIESMVSAAKKYGTGSGASRLVSGTSEIHEKLEKAVSEFKGTESCLLFNSGYQANTGIIPAIAGEESIIFSDTLNHASLIDGMRLSKSKIHIYPHRNVQELSKLLDRYNHGSELKWIITDTIFSMDGDIAPLAEITGLAEKHDAFLMVDEAHATGIRGPEGKGVAHELKVNDKITIQMGTFSKALGSFGAYAAGSRDMVEYLINTVRSFIFTTALPPPVAAASYTAVKLVRSGDDLRSRLMDNVRFFKKGLHEQGWQIGSTDSHIIPVITGDAGYTMQISKRLFELGVWAQGIRPPAVPHGKSRLRLTPMATHTTGQLSRALDQFEKVRKEYYISGCIR